MGGKESTLKEQAWCNSSALSCKNCVTEVENAQTEIKRSTPVPRGEIQNMISDQKKSKYESSTKQSSLPTTKNNNTIFQSDEKKLQFKSALKQENRIEKLQQLKGTASVLELKILSSAFLEKGEILKINPLGLDEGKSLRKANDGFTYFGCKKSIKKTAKSMLSPKQFIGNGQQSSQQMGATGTSVEDDDELKCQTVQKEVVNDFVIPTKNDEEKEKHRGRQFQIYFDTDNLKYKIKDLGIGYGAFVKLSSPIVLKDNFLLNMGESYIVANLLKPQDDLIGIVAVNKIPQKLRLKIFSVVKADQPDVYCCQNEDQEIIIGRTPNCDIRIEDKLLSKAQASIKYDGSNWVLIDGFEGKESTNGTWLYLNEDCEIEDGMVFKSNQTFFEAKLTNQSQ